MIKNKKGETIVGILIGVFIISIVVLGVSSLINYSRTVIKTYARSTRVTILKDNLNNIIKGLDISNVRENEIFYIYKNNTTKQFQIFTGSTNVSYKYIDKNGDKVDDLVGYSKDIYARILWVEREDTSIKNSNKLLRASIRRLIKK